MAEVRSSTPNDVQTGRRILFSPMTDTRYVATKWTEQGEGQVLAHEKEIVTDDDRLFVPLKTEHYRGFETGLKDVELRGVNHMFNPATIRVGRPVELRRGYNTGDSLWRLITEVWTFDALEEIPSALDFNRIQPGATLEEFLETARELVGQYEQWVAFEVGEVVRGDPA